MLPIKCVPYLSYWQKVTRLGTPDLDFPPPPPSAMKLLRIQQADKIGQATRLALQE